MIHAPMMRADGSILTTPGYDVTTGVLYLPTFDVPTIPDEPTTEQVAAARELVLAVLAEFPWASGDHDRANFIAAMLLPLLREIIPPPWPMWLLNAHQMGSGKTLLSKILRILHGGVHRTKLPHDDDELRKSLTAILSTTTGTVIVFDNQTGVLSSGELANLLTSRERSDRRLGETEEVSMRNDRMIVATGNNIAVAGDIPRRVVWSTIDPNMPRPWERVGFTIPNLERYVEEHRGEIIAALLTLARAWVVAGMPVEAESRTDDYGRLVSVVRGLLGAVGIDGVFMDPSTDRAEMGIEDEEWRHFLAAVHAGYGDKTFTAKELRKRLDGFDSVRENLPEEIAARLRGPSGGLTAVSLGKFMTNRVGRHMGEYVIRQNMRRDKTRVFRVEVHGGGSVQVTKSGTAGASEVPPSPPATARAGGDSGADAGGCRGCRGYLSQPRAHGKSVCVSTVDANGFR